MFSSSEMLKITTSSSPHDTTPKSNSVQLQITNFLNEQRFFVGCDPSQPVLYCYIPVIYFISYTVPKAPELGIHNGKNLNSPK